MHSEHKGKKDIMGAKVMFIIMALFMLVFFQFTPCPAQDFHGFLGYYPPPAECMACHDSMLGANHQGDCTICHDISYSLKLCIPIYPPGFDFTTVCINDQTPLKEPFSCGDCHINPGDHSSVHDLTLLPEASCSQCHVADAPSEHEKYSLNCTTCHNSSKTIVQDAIDRGKNGIPVYCSDCHGQINHEAHKNSYVPHVYCSECHMTKHDLEADLINEHAKENLTCDACHNSTDPVVQAAVDNGTSGSSIYCADCHIQFDNHALQHDQTVLASPACGECHVPNAVTEHLSHGVHNIGCLRCHVNADTGILAAIDSGMAGQGVSCGDCHILDGNRVPIANCGADLNVWKGLAIQFSGLESFDHDGTILSYQWDFDDGTEGVSGPEVYHIFGAEGTYQVRLTVNDDQGATDTDTCLVTVLAPIVKVKKVWTTDLNNVVKTTFNPGDPIRYHVRFTINGSFYTVVKGVARNTSGINWIERFRRKKTIPERRYHWAWNKTIPLDATPDSTAKIKFVVQIYDEPGCTLLGERRKTAFFNVQ